MEERDMKECTRINQWRLGQKWAVVVMAVLLLVSSASLVLAGSTGDVIDDSLITTKVKSSFVADSTVSALDISVETNQGVVTLTGLVTNETERQRAVQIARETSGVKQVDAKNLIVKR
jgi:osmotically-inducible protein OsmY